MQVYRLAFIGFGNVGQGLARILLDRRDWLRDQFEATFQVVAVSDFVKGSLYDPDGLDLAVLLDTVQDSGKIDTIAAPHTGWDALQTITSSNANIVVEMSYTDLNTGEPAITHVREALKKGKHVTTTNKGPIALAFPELRNVAAENQTLLGIEGTVMSGTPALRLGSDILRSAGISRIQGILNGTTNYILTQMETGASYTDALADAQARGYAEADPTGDVDGHDAAGKVVILANLLMGASLTMHDVACTGISHITAADVQTALAANEHWKLIGLVEQKPDGTVQAEVKPQRIPHNHPLASIGGATNAITYTTDLLGDVTLVGPGAGRTETGYALLSDMLAIHQRQKT